MKNSQIYIAFVFILLFASCANIVAPNGGPRDLVAPKILNKTSVDSLLNFKGGNIIIEFDEYIKLDNVQQYFNISPLTKKMPKIQAKKKTLVISLPDSLLESNTTYSLDFGDAVRDLREGNVYKNLSLTLSTGAYFDSLFFNGKVYDAQTGIGDSLTVMLYAEDTPDSMILKQRPLYTNKAARGGFSFKGLPNKKFKLAALADKNANYIYDALGEKIAFTDQVINTEKPDSAFELYSFIEESMIDTSEVKGGLKKKGGVSKKGDGEFAYTFSPDLKRMPKMYYQDTLKIILGDNPAQVNTDKIRFYEDKILDLSMISVYDDSNGVITLYPHWEMGADYMLVLQKAFLKDTLGKGSVADTITFKTMKAEDYSSIIVTVDSTLYEKEAILLLYRNDDEVGRSTDLLKVNTFSLLKPETYRLRILYDKNGNGKWDSGKLKERTQPERTIELPKRIALRANWENKIEWTKDSKKKRMGK